MNTDTKPKSPELVRLEAAHRKAVNNYAVALKLEANHDTIRHHAARVKMYIRAINVERARLSAEGEK